MFEKRPIWGLIVGLNVCILIWLISVQEPVMFDASTSAISSSSNNFIINAGAGVGAEARSADVAAAADVMAGSGSEGGGGGGNWGRDLLSKHVAMQSNEYLDEMPVFVSTLTTLNLSSNNNNDYSNNNSTNSNTIKKTSFLNAFDMKTTTKTSDLSSDMQSLTSSLGTGVLDFKSKPTPSWAALTAASSALPDEDFNQLIDLHNFQFLMAQPVCGTHVEALVLIHSAPKNYEKRQTIRETWASISHHTPESPLRVLFLLGAVIAPQVQDDLITENNLYGDIIQGSFIDDYRNMTYKHIMAFKWFLYNCPEAQILIKVDDDVYVNTPQLIKYFKGQQQRQQQQQSLNEINNPTIATTAIPNNTSNTTTNTTTNSSIASNKTKFSIFNDFNIFSSLSSLSSSSSASSTFNASNELFNHPQNLLFCQKIIGSLVKRSYRSKWRVSFKEYSERYYPPYCPGYAIIYSPDIIFRLYTAAQNSKYFWIDDVHITGVLAQQTNTTITTSSHYMLYSDECDQILTGKTDLNKVEFLFAWHNISPQKIKLLWHLQMMSIQTPDDLYYVKKMSVLDNDDNHLLYETEQQQHPKQQQYQHQHQHSQTNDPNYVYNRISSSHSYTSSRGLR